MVLADSHGVAAVLLGIQLVSLLLSTTRLSLSLVQFSAASSSGLDSMSLSHNPSSKNYWFRLFPLRSPLLGESHLISLPSATKMFQFAEFARAGL
jgi:hypothetical protein